MFQLFADKNSISANKLKTDLNSRVKLQLKLIQGKLVPKLRLGPFLTLKIRNGLSVSFGTNVPCNKIKCIEKILKSSNYIFSENGSAY